MTGKPNGQQLEPCRHRVGIAIADHYFCRHRQVRIPNQLVSADVCRTCTLIDQPLATSHPVPPPNLSADELRSFDTYKRRRARKLPPSHDDWAELRHQVEQRVTIGITAFKRPDSLVRFVESIRRFYPHIRIIIADNGDEPALIKDPNVEYLQLPFDVGLSASRNAIVNRLNTPYLLITEDDFEFTAVSRIEKLLDILEQDETIGAAAGSLLVEGEYEDFAADLQVFRDELHCLPPRQPLKRTVRGTVYQIVDLVVNFVLFRKETLAEHRWDEQLKLAEHREYFYSVKRAARWRVALSRSVQCLHHQPRGAEYRRYRFRDDISNYRELWQRRSGLTKVHLPTENEVTEESIGQPNVILFGVGHSGTSIVTRMLLSLRWHGAAHPEDLDEEFSENIPIRQLNDQVLQLGELSEYGARRELHQLPTPWVIKDPRFVHTIEHWLPMLDKWQPTLVWLVRDLESVKASYRRRQSKPTVEPRSRGHNIDALFHMAQATFQKWPWGKLRIEFEQIAETVSLFSAHRAGLSVEGSPDFNMNQTITTLVDE